MEPASRPCSTVAGVGSNSTSGARTSTISGKRPASPLAFQRAIRSRMLSRATSSQNSMRAAHYRW